VGWDEDDGHFSAGTVANWEAAGMRTSGIESFQPPSIDAPVLAEIVRRLAEAYRPERIYLFGSTARGDAGPDSDYDLMIIVREDTPSYLRSEDLAYRVLRGTGTAADVLVWTRNNFDRQLHLKASLPSTVIREGKLLYGAG
jgi:predicted nucleotidyltransferase